MKSPGWIRIGAVASACAVAGAGAGIAGSTAAPGTTATQRSAPGRPHDGFGRHGKRFGRDRPVHVQATVLNDAGTAYITRIVDNGVVKAVSGQDLTITEGTAKVPYKDVTVAVPDAATIVRNGVKATLADLKAGDHVFVSASSDRTKVFAADDTFRPRHRHGFRHRFGGPPGPGGPFPEHP